MRLLKALRDRFGLSRALAERFIAGGRVWVDGERVEDPSIRVKPDSFIYVDGLYVALNKPEGYVVSRSEKGKPVVYDLLPPDLLMLKPVGRLDMDSQGLLILVGDGLLQHRLTHPKYGVRRGYIALLDREWEPELFEKMKEGVESGGDFLRAVEAFPVSSLEVPENLRDIWLEGIEDPERGIYVELAHGKYREIRRMLWRLGYDTRLLRRVSYGSILLDVPSGEWRALSMDEVRALYRDAGFQLS